MAADVVPNYPARPDRDLRDLVRLLAGFVELVTFEEMFVKDGCFTV